jgi:hypothetical protein
MLRDMPWRQFREWMEYDKLEPIGGKRGDWQAASVCAMLLNAAALQRSGKLEMRFRPEMFLLEYDARSAPDSNAPAASTAPAAPAPATKGRGQSWQEQKMIAQMWVALSQAERDKRQKNRERAERAGRR